MASQFEIDTDLHIEIKKKTSQEEILELINRNPEYCRKQDRMHFTPLHLAIQNKYSFEVIEALIKEFPEATQVTTIPFKSTPLHLAFDCSLEIVELLVRIYPDACGLKDFYNCTPIHQFCAHQSIIDCKNSIDRVRLLARTNPSAMDVRDTQNRKPSDNTSFQISPFYLDMHRIMLHANFNQLSSEDLNLFRNLNWRASRNLFRVYVKFATMCANPVVDENHGAESPDPFVRVIARFSLSDRRSSSVSKAFEFFHLVHPYSKPMTNVMLKQIVLFL